MRWAFSTLLSNLTETGGLVTAAVRVVVWASSWVSRFSELIFFYVFEGSAGASFGLLHRRLAVCIFEA